jgi:hypothetical protein
MSGVEAIPDHRQEFQGGGEENHPALSDQAVDNRRSQISLPVSGWAIQIHPGNLSLHEADDRVECGHHLLIECNVEVLERAFLERAPESRVARDAIP